MKRRFALAALLLAAAPLHAQDARPRRFDGGTFSIELPAGLPALQLMRAGGTATTESQIFGGRHVDGSAVVVMRSRLTGQGAADTAARRRDAMRVLNDSALIAQYVAFGDTSRAYRDKVRSALVDTALDGRQYALRQVHATFSAVNQAAFLEVSGDPREIVTDERVTLRSPVTLRLQGMPPLHGTADLMVPRRGEMVLWIVVRAAPRRGPAFDAATERMLDSFRITERP